MKAIRDEARQDRDRWRSSIVTDGLCTYPAAVNEIGIVDRQEVEDGVDYGIESGWFSAGLARYLRLTDVGFNKIAAHRIGCFVILGHASSTSFKLI